MKTRLLTFATAAVLGACSTSCNGTGGLSAKDALTFARGSLAVYRDYKVIRATK